ncbi:Hypothetical protein NTJ_03624 [Nesidiocoris tenuis]|uniref:Uncharacterized protein n=1 Tax=Nesidiocoris tenuis TaxID=355587 RepID=A0ABN7AEV3_9HEMI|nr:Hypothetical protein NTJ_03624 [Nesidiocoris tenuis]
MRNQFDDESKSRQERPTRPKEAGISRAVVASTEEIEVPLVQSTPNRLQHQPVTPPWRAGRGWHSKQDVEVFSDPDYR